MERRKGKEGVFWRVLACLMALLLALLALGWVVRQGEDVEVIAEGSLEEEEEIPYPTNVESLKGELGERAFVDERGGMVFLKPEGYEAVDMDEYYLLYSEDAPEGCLVVISNSDYEFDSGFDYYAASIGVKERLKYRIDGRDCPTTLYDLNGNVEACELYGRDYWVESEKGYASGGLELDLTFYNYGSGGLGYCVGMALRNRANSERVKSALRELMESVRIVEYTGGHCERIEELFPLVDCKCLGVGLKIPQGFIRQEMDSNLVVFKPPACLGDPMRGSAVVVLKDESFGAGNPFHALDYTYRVSEQRYADCLCQNESVRNGRRLETAMLSGQKNIETQKGSFQRGDVMVTSRPGVADGIDTFPAKEVHSLHFAAEASTGEVVNIAFMGIDGYSYERMRQLGDLNFQEAQR